MCTCFVNKPLLLKLKRRTAKIAKNAEKHEAEGFRKLKNRYR